MKITAKRVFNLFKNAATDWSDDRAPQLGASLAFYTIFSLAPLLTIVVTIAGLWFSNNASDQIFSQLGNVIGAKNASFLQGILVQPAHEKSGLITGATAIIMLVVGATGVFVQLQDALNQIWEVKQKPGQGIMGFVRHRLLSFAMVLGIAFLLLVSLLLTTAIAAVGKFFGSLIGDMGWVLQAINMIVSFGLITLLFALMFKYVPDAEISWKDVWVGAAVTSLLFAIGKFALGLYLGHSSLASTYKAAGALIITLLWVYYTAQILFFGAEITQKYAKMAGREVQPSPHAEWDAQKICKADAQGDYRERKNAAKKPEAKKPASQNAPSPAPSLPQGAPARTPSPALAYAASSHASHQPASVLAVQPPRKTSFGKLILLLLVLIPIEKKLFNGPGAKASA
jgi:membrane protein